MTSAEKRAFNRAKLRAIEILHSKGYWVIKNANINHAVDLVGLKENDLIFIKVIMRPKGKPMIATKELKRMKNAKAPKIVKKELWLLERGRGFHFITAN